jgi:periplasmic protein TonB
LKTKIRKPKLINFFSLKSPNVFLIFVRYVLWYMSGLEEILFESRNKKYGAYQLRKKANKYRLIGILLSLGIILITSVSLFIILNAELFFPPKYPANISIDAMQMADLQNYLFPEPPKAQEKSGVDLNKPLVVDSVQEEKKKVEASEKKAAANDTITKKGMESPEDGQGANVNGDSLYVRVDKMPKFIGGNEELIKFLRKNLAETAKKCKTRQRVVVQFTVSKTGDVKEVAVIFGANVEINNEIIRVITMLPRWEPAQQSGHPVSFRFNLPINL